MNSAGLPEWIKRARRAVMGAQVRLRGDPGLWIKKGHWPARVMLVVLVAGVHTGCGGDARVELSAADTIDRMVREVEAAFGEYHAEVQQGDERREMRLASDFVSRVRKDADNDAVLEQHAADFVTALGRIREDREVESRRHAGVLDHVQLMREVSAGLREVGLQNLYLDQEVRRYFVDVLDRVSNSSANAGQVSNLKRDGA